ncbi:MAG: ATP synthase F1 subunit gamma [Alphaproteobacteria bacterium]|nr:ATP synthase F1 subunit gamma [Alphaproteobacteria bacterium]
MAGLKELRGRIDSVKSTRRITSAMKMVASAKLRRAQERAGATRDFARTMHDLTADIGAQYLNPVTGEFYSHAPLLMRGGDGPCLYVVIGSDRGLCGGFNVNVLRAMRNELAQNPSARLVTVGRKVTGSSKRNHKTSLLKSFEELHTNGAKYSHASMIADEVLPRIESGEFGRATLIYNRFVSALTQEVTILPLVPIISPTELAVDAASPSATKASGATGGAGAPKTNRAFEPEESAILEELLPRNVTVQIYRGLIESFAAEQAARMTAMDNASRNAGKFIDELTQKYNQLRQAAITKELIEIISGAEAV